MLSRNPGHDQTKMWKMRHGILVVIFSLATQVSSQEQSCQDNNDLPWTGRAIGEDSDRVGRRTQVIITEDSFMFSCHGNVTEWGVDLYPRASYTIALQVWREIGRNRYSSVGANSLTTTAQGIVTLNIRETPASQIQVRPGDLIGFSVIDAPTTTDAGIIIDKSASVLATYVIQSDTPVNGATLRLDSMSSSPPVISVSVVAETSTSPTFTSTLVPTPTPSPSSPTEATTALSLDTMLIPTQSTESPTEATTVAGVLDASPVGLIVGIMFMLLSMIILAGAVIVIAVFIYRKRKTKTFKQRKVARNYIDNPGYGSSPATENLISVMPANIIYENPENLTQDYSYADIVETVQTKAQLNSMYTYIPHKSESSTRKGSQGEGSEHKEYGGMELANLSSQEEWRDMITRQNKLPLYHTLEPSEPPKGIGVLNSAGLYVPTEKQRTELLEVHYESMDSRVYDKPSFFVEDEIYWAPASTTSGLYEQLAAKRYREIPRKQIGKLEVLGTGQFGEVFKTMWAVSGASLDVAVKMLRIEASEDEKVKFLQEAAIMGQFMHPNIVKLYGVVTVGEPVMICLELMKHGDLQGYLNKLDKSEANLQHRFLKFAREIATGMDYLSKKSFVHRDLAARNILLNDSLTCKIGDFGMARDLMDDTYYTATGGKKIPVKWTAPEALFYKKYSTDSDVWSYGMVLFEIWSVGKKPFSEHTNREVARFIQDGYCQAPPPGCPRPIYQLMVNCWCPQHENRPIFREICIYLQQPPSQLLTFDLLDSTDSKANTLGEDLRHGKELYLDLQQKYKGVS